jgi:hypothetical protein
MAKNKTNKVVETKEIEQPIATVETATQIENTISEVKPVAKKKRNRNKKTVKQATAEVKQDIVEIVEDVKDTVDDVEEWFDVVKVEATDLPITWKVKFMVFLQNIKAKFTRLF